MTTQEIADRLVELNRNNDHQTAYAELYSPHVRSVETWDGSTTAYQGMEGIARKGEAWFANVVEMHATRVSDPLVADQSFAVTFFMDVTYKDRGRVQMTELAVYTVQDGKIIREEFQA